MTFEDVRRIVEPETAALRSRGVTALYVFGSVARGEAGSASDVDFIVDYDPVSEFNLIDLAGVHRRLSERSRRQRRRRDANRNSSSYPRSRASRGHPDRLMARDSAALALFWTP
jgi:uncharacterized protein